MIKIQHIDLNAKILSLFILFVTVSSMTGTQISQKCHCDLTSSFCDIGCCCDTDCGTSISDSCFYAKSSIYCPKTQFFKSIKSGATASNMCYYYNASTTLIDQQSLTNTQRIEVISKSSQTSPFSSTINSGYKGYKLSAILTIGSKNSFSFVDSSGNCLTSGSSSTLNMRFGHNTKILCLCNNCGTPLLFSDFIGKTIAQFYDTTSNNITLPSINDSSITTLKLNFIIGKYGSQKIKYIDKITYSTQSNGSNIRTLYLNFIDSDNINQQVKSASFFPQIPLDMFYPIHVMS